MAVLADVYTAIHHVIKPLILIADGSKVNSCIQELEHEECIHCEQGRRCNSCSISRWPSVMTSWCSSAWKEKWTLSDPDSIDLSVPCPVWWADSQQCRRCRLWVHIVWELLPCALGCAPESSRARRCRPAQPRPRVSMDSLSSGFTLQLAKAVQINLPLRLETCSVAYWTVKF